MAHITYPNATHTRFAHSIGTFHVMDRLLKRSDIVEGLDDDVMKNLRLAALLHDIGHYPYSHLMERVDSVQLTEEVISDGGKTTLTMGDRAYPSHERVGELIVTSQPDLVQALGGPEKAKELAQYLGQARAAEAELNQLISSSLDMDRLDYLLRDSHATGVPYGNVDINYLLRNVCRAKDGTLCITRKGIPAADHFLLARFFMHRTVYYHKTIFGMEEACRQLLRRIRNTPASCKKYNLPANGKEVEDIVTKDHLYRFTDAFVDEIVHYACSNDDPIVSLLANSIESRLPPKQIGQVEILAPRNTKHHAGATFKLNCRHQLGNLCQEHDLMAGQFLLTETKPLAMEKRGVLLRSDEAKHMDPATEEELIKIWVDPNEEPKSLVDVDYSLISQCSNLFYQAFRLYFVPTSDTRSLADELKLRVANWHNPL